MSGFFFLAFKIFILLFFFFYTLVIISLISIHVACVIYLFSSCKFSFLLCLDRFITKNNQVPACEWAKAKY